MVVPIADEGEAIGVEEQEGAVIEEDDGEAHKEGHKDDIGDGKEVAEEEGSLFVDLEHVFEVLHMNLALLRKVGPLLLVQTRQEAVQGRQEGRLAVIDQFLQERPPGVVQREHRAVREKSVEILHDEERVDKDLTANPDGRDLTEGVDLIEPALWLVVAEIDVNPLKGDLLFDEEDLNTLRKRTQNVAIELEHLVRVISLLDGGDRTARNGGSGRGGGGDCAVALREKRREGR